MSKVKVAVRVRPMNRREVDLNTSCCIDMTPQQTFLEHTGKGQKKFNFDYCFWSMDAADPKFSSQQHVFECLGADILDNAFDGYNACIFAYGQTGSGKSYTMMGSPSDKGVIPKLCDTIFERIHDKQGGDSRLTCKVEVSYMEIYNEKVRDLLGAHSKHSLRVREHKVLGPYVDGLSKLAVSSFHDIEKLMDDGNKARTVASTNMNEQSSRSHAVFNLLMTQTFFDPATQAGNEKVSKLSLVDLAGSERAGKTGAEGDRLKEGSNINKSLTTLGLVISNLADNAGGKRKTSFIPYRDSVLTWLLKDNLGGNSKTVMVATISPSADNYEETLSTLRYADRAKRIVNNAVVNEDANSKVVRELREEVERLRAMIGGGGAGGIGGGEGGGATASEIAELQDKLSISERLMKEMSLTWEQKLANTQLIAEERAKALQNMGISVHKAGIALESGRFYLVNLNADPSLSEMLVYYLKEHTAVGRSGSNNQPDILLRGLGIQQHHCELVIEGTDVIIKPIGTAKTCVNGKAINEPQTLCNGDRIVWGNNHFFRVSCSRQPDPVETEAGTTAPADMPLVDFEFAKRELALSDMSGDVGRVVTALQQKHTSDKQDALDEQKKLYETKLAALREQLGSASTSASPIAGGTALNASEKSASQDALTALAEEQLELEEAADMGAVRDLVLHANGMVSEANQLSEEMGKDTKFSVALQLPKSMLSPRPKDSSQPQYEVVVNVMYKTRGTHTVWSVDKLEDKLFDMREMYDKLQEGALMGDLTGPDPFYELESHTLIGVANIFLDCLQYNVPLEYSPPIIDPRGEVCGRLSMEIKRIAQVRPGDAFTDGKDQWELMDEDELLLDAKIAVEITIIEATGLPPALCHFVFCQYVFFDEQQAVIVPPMREASSKPPLPGKVTFKQPHICNVVVSEDFMSYIQSDCLAIEIWGHRSKGFGDGIGAPLPPGGEVVPAEALVSNRSKTLQERWMEVMRRLEMWVEIQELNDYGEYAPVEVIDRPDCRTGGIFLLRQGQSRRVHVSVAPVRGSGLAPISCHSVISVSMGAVIHQNKQAHSLDSYQDSDLQRLRQRWSDALMRRRAFLDDQIHRIVDKKDRQRDDNYKESELIDEWTQLQIERQVVLEPEPGTGVPGAPSSRHRFIPVGMELRIPTAFMDVKNNVPTDATSLIEVGDVLLSGEDDASMIELPLLHKDGEGRREVPVSPMTQTGQVSASMEVSSVTASWDTSIHDNQHLNLHTANMDRVYMIVKAKVKMQYPPNYVLVVRKRICLKIYKKLGLGTLVKKKLAAKSDERHHCGVSYEVVYAIPKQAGMDRPSTPTNITAPDDEGDQEIVIERYSHGMSSVQSILSLDRLRQELAVKEGLAAAGRKPRPASTNTPAPAPPVMPVVVAATHPSPLTSSSPAPAPHSPDLEESRSNSRSTLAPPLSTVGGLAPTPPLKRAARSHGAVPTASQPQTRSPSQSPVHFTPIQRSGLSAAETASPILAHPKADTKRTKESVSPAEVAQPAADNSQQSEVDVLTQDKQRDGDSTGATPSVAAASEPAKKISTSSLPDVVPPSTPQSVTVTSNTDVAKESAAGSSDPVPPAVSREPSSGDRPDSPPEASHTAVSANGVQLQRDVPSKETVSSSSIRPEQSNTTQEPGVAPMPPTGDRSVARKQLKMSTSSAVSIDLEDAEASKLEAELANAPIEPPAAPVSSVADPPLAQVSSAVSPEHVSHSPSLPSSVTSSAATHDELLHSSAVSSAAEPTSVTSSQSTVSAPAVAPIEPANKPSLTPDQISCSPSPTTSISPTPSQEDEVPSSNAASATSVSAAAAATPPPPPVSTEPLPKVGDLVMVDLANGYKMGVVKFVGTTEFQPGDWIGVALDQPKGKHDGSVKGTRYFKCKPKHGVFVRNDKLIKAPLGGGSTASSAAKDPPTRRSMSPAGSAPVVANPPKRRSGDLPSYARGTTSSSRKNRGP